MQRGTGGRRAKYIGFKAESVLWRALDELAGARSVSALLRELAWEWVHRNRAKLTAETRRELDRAPKVRGRYRA